MAASPASMPADFNLANYDYDLAEDRIAQFPSKDRGQSRLLALSRSDPGYFRDARFGELCNLLPENALLVANNSRVVPARLIGRRPRGGKAELLLLTPLPLLDRSGKASAAALLKPAAKIKLGDILDFGAIRAEVVEKGEYGSCRVELSWEGDLEQALELAGRLPLPPYIKRAPEESDRSRYQTIYASRSGSVAAPTAGLHFTAEILESLARRGIGWAEISLHVGYGTFSPVRAADIREHKMHGELVEVDEAAADAINAARKQGRTVVAVGTTTVRSLEGVFRERGEIAPFLGVLDPFIYPGYKFQVIDGLITNFHLPKSTLLMLVAAFIGRERVLAAYAEALRRGYRFFSYGDAMLIRP